MSERPEQAGEGAAQPGRRRTIATRGSNQARVRAYNLRLVLSVVQRLGAPSKAEIARLTGLSAQTATIIVRELESEGLIVRGEPRRGKVGQPSIPIALDPDGAYSLGFKVGRRSNDMVLVDLAGTIRARARVTHDFPDPEAAVAFAEQGYRDLTAGLTRERKGRIAGLGIAQPFFIWDWGEILGVSSDRTEPWRTADLAADLAARLPVKVTVENDCTAACGAEHLYGVGAGRQDFVYLYIAAFVGGGIVLNGALYPGPTGNAGAFGPMPVQATGDDVRLLTQMAGLSVLERMLKTAGLDISAIWEQPSDWAALGTVLDEWIAFTARHLAYAIGSACSVIDFPVAIVDGAFPDDVRTRLVEQTRAAMAERDMRGLNVPEVLAGQTGPLAPALGGASLPLIADYFLDRNALMLEAG